ncbi:hypothetical protein PaeBR_20810 [Paenibacillus sp. BR2-3]|uniref:hypothetical protein n=1 Tax=Paenibacillus sp. BR2-3 TaxID=3048494 RepID=UPI0039775F67
MKKIEWLIAILFMGMGLMCMTISAISFRSDSLLYFGGYVKTFLLCTALLVLFIFLLVKWFHLGKKR